VKENPRPVRDYTLTNMQQARFGVQTPEFLMRRMIHGGTKVENMLCEMLESGGREGEWVCVRARLIRCNVSKTYLGHSYESLFNASGVSASAFRIHLMLVQRKYGDSVRQFYRMHPTAKKICIWYSSV
jgi:hypothetical protein